MVNLLIINRAQYGYHTDTFEYTRRIPANKCVTYLSLNCNRPEVENFSDRLSVKYSVGSKSKFRLVRFLGFIYSSLVEMRSAEKVFLVYFPFCSILRVFYSNIILDVRTRNVNFNKILFTISNWLLKSECSVFGRVTVVSEELGEWLGKANFEVIPLGSNPVLSSRSSKSEVKLAEQMAKQLEVVYLGAFQGRDIEYLVKEIAIVNKTRKVILTLIGETTKNHMAQLVNLVSKLKVQENIIFLGYLNRNQLPEIMKSKHVGLVHIPVLDQYSGQPSTKLFEYWGYGLPVLASNYDQNRKFITSATGQIYQTSPGSLACKLADFSMDDFDYGEIAYKANENSWEVAARKFWEICVK